MPKFIVSPPNLICQRNFVITNRWDRDFLLFDPKSALHHVCVEKAARFALRRVAIDRGHIDAVQRRTDQPEKDTGQHEQHSRHRDEPDRLGPADGAILRFDPSEQCIRASGERIILCGRS